MLEFSGFVNSWVPLQSSWQP